MKISDLDTPSLIVDLSLWNRNLTYMKSLAQANNKKLRPHIKTHKSSVLAQRQLDAGGCVGVCVAKLSEAEVLVNKGIGPILITSPVTAQAKLEKLAALLIKGDLTLVVDNFENAQTLNELARRNKVKLKVLLDVDPRMGRTGVAMAEAGSFFRELATLEDLRLTGIQCYAGNLQHIASATERYALSKSILSEAETLVRNLRMDGFACPVFTGSGTGTCHGDMDIALLTDLQVGSYCLMDSEYRALEGLSSFEYALKLLTTVVSVNQSGFVTVDAGLKALYYTPHAPPQVLSNNQIDSEYEYNWFGDEHGRLSYRGSRTKPSLNERFILTVPHCDPTVNLHKQIYLVEGSEVIETIPVDLRGMCQ